MATTKGDHHASHHSSIALLQERFRQLQKIREMRQERELLHVLSTSESERIYISSSSNNSNPTATMQKYPYNFPQKRPSSQLALSLWPDSQMTNNSNILGGFETQNNGSTTMVNNKLPWLHDATTVGHNKSSDITFKFDDIDTSLHL